MNPSPSPSCCGSSSSSTHSAVRDPVCGMSVQRGVQRGVEHGGETYYFCCPRCREQFIAQPERYVSPANTQATGACCAASST